MIKKDSVKSKFGVDVAVSNDMANAIDLWCKMYNDRPPWLSDTVKSLGLASAISSEIARLVTIEMNIEVSGSDRADYIKNQLDINLDELRRYVEYGCAKGGLIFKPYIDNGNIAIDYVQADCFFPTAFDSSGRMIGCVFVDRIQQNDRHYTRMEYHNMENGGCRIINKAFASQNVSELGNSISLDSVDSWAGLEEDVLIKGIDKPLFAYFKVPQANNIDNTSPLGVSVFARAVDLIKEADKQYSRLLWEFESGERALYVDMTAFKRDNNGKPILPNKRLYKTLDVNTPELFEDFTPTLRETNIINGLDSILAKIEDVCGLSRGTFSQVQNEARTATELKMLRQRSYSTIADTQKSLQKALTDLVYAIDIWCTLGKLAPMGKYDIAFEWDDSIISDRQAEFIEKTQLVSLGIMSAEDFRMWYFGETEKQAQEKLNKDTSMFGGDE